MRRNTCLNCGQEMPEKTEARFDKWLEKLEGLQESDEPIWTVFEGWIELFLKDFSQGDDESTSFPNVRFIYLCPNCAKKLLSDYQEWSLREKNDN